MSSSQLTPLFCKPPYTQEKNTIVYSNFADTLHGVIEFRSLNLRTDLEMIHQWVNMEYALAYWQMDGRFSQLYSIYQCMELNPFAHSFIGLFNGQIVCQFDLYSIVADELKNHVPVEPHDCGFHLLMGPHSSRTVHGLTKTIVHSFLSYYFSFPAARRMYAEPDVNNARSICLLEKCGFDKRNTVDMSYKRAAIYCFDRPA